MFLLDVTGRKTGARRSVMLMHVPRGDALIVIGSAGGSDETPNWYKNLIAAGGAEVQVGEKRWAVTARELDEGSERQECWELATQVYEGFDAYQRYTERRLPVAVLEPTTQAPRP